MLSTPDVERVSCNICGQNNADVIVRGSGPLQIVKCRNDGLLYMDPRPRLDRVRQFHAGFVQPDNLPYFAEYRREILEREAREITATVRNGRLLDVGCATGTFFEAFRGPDWELYGVDTSYLAAKIAGTRSGAQVFCGTIQQAAYPGEFFDVVTVLDALYYSPDPKAELREIHRVLRDSGLLAIEIPGYLYTRARDRGPLCWLLDGRWMRGFTNCLHLYHFSPQTITSLLEASGFEILKAIPEQASLGRSGVIRLINDVHFGIARRLFAATRGGISIAAKEFYLARKIKLA